MERKNPFNFLFIIALLLLNSNSCSSYKPILLDNQKYQEMQESRAKYEIDLCVEESNELSNQQIISEGYYNSADTLTKDFSNIISQSILGNKNKTNLINSTIRNSGSTTSTAIKSYHQTKNNPHANVKNYIVSCLGRKGLVVIGWK